MPESASRLRPYRKPGFVLAMLLLASAHFGSERIGSADLLRPTDCWALRRGQPHLTDGGVGQMRCAHLDPGPSLAGVATLCVPLVAQGETLGMLHANAPSGGGPEDNDATVISSVGEQLAMAMANLRLHETLRVQSLRDPLTGLFNRRTSRRTWSARCSAARARACRCRC